ncbi:hypothetical protein BaRGS_00009422 [Batillaria attramentaria]|uniref:Uncharacterized protein n=1 Tax=Batillaria attramentaria TaxID=370345 RepID=A0ABD0LJE1_9CAEN
MKPVSTGAFVFVTFSCAAFVAGNKNNLRVFSEIKNGNDSNCSTVNSAAVAIKLTKDGKTTGSHVSSHDRRGLRTGLQFQGSGIGAKTSPSGSAKGPNDFMSRTSNSRLSNTLKSGKYRSTSAAYRRLENSLLAFLGVHDVVQKQKDARQDKSENC